MHAVSHSPRPPKQEDEETYFIPVNSARRVELEPGSSSTLRAPTYAREQGSHGDEDNLNIAPRLHDDLVALLAGALQCATASNAAPRKTFNDLGRLFEQETASVELSSKYSLLEHTLSWASSRRMSLAIDTGGHLLGSFNILDCTAPCHSHSFLIPHLRIRKLWLRCTLKLRLVFCFTGMGTSPSLASPLARVMYILCAVVTTFYHLRI